MYKYQFDGKEFIEKLFSEKEDKYTFEKNIDGCSEALTFLLL